MLGEISCRKNIGIIAGNFPPVRSMYGRQSILMDFCSLLQLSGLVAGKNGGQHRHN
jgi:hypothetical protein